MFHFGYVFKGRFILMRAIPGSSELEAPSGLRVTCSKELSAAPEWVLTGKPNAPQGAMGDADESG
jgi:hypothetical protein